MQRQQQRQRRRSMGQQHLGACGGLHEMHGFDGRSTSFTQAGNSAAASWSAIPYTGRQAAKHPAGGGWSAEAASWMDYCLAQTPSCC
jgi:hypothetical protein